MNRYPLRVEARRDEPLSRWLWLVKWLLLIPHYIVLAVLWVGFVVLTLVAYVAVLFTGRYPRAIYAYNLGVLRWTWRVNYYGYHALGTDRYPPFTLAEAPDYPARLYVDDPPRPPRWLPLVAWLFAIPHILLVGALTGAATWQIHSGSDTTTVPLGVVTVGVVVAGISLLCTGRYPRGLYHLLLGVARWNLRVTAYLALLTPRYPPFRLDQGETEPDDEPTGPSGVAAESVSAYLPRDSVPHRGSVAGPVIALIAGVLLLAPGAGLCIGGGALLTLDSGRDAAGYLASPAFTLQSPTAAITAEDITLEGSERWTRGFSDVGGVRMSATSPTDIPLFIGIAPQSAVDAWLGGTAHDSVRSVTSGAARYTRATGEARAVSNPAAQTFWVASGTGVGSASLTWQAADGNYAVVLARADGSVGVAADVRVATQVPDLTGLGAGLLTAGVIVGLLAVFLIVIGGLGLGRRHDQPPTGPNTGGPNTGGPSTEGPSTGGPSPQRAPTSPPISVA